MVEQKINEILSFKGTKPDNVLSWRWCGQPDKVIDSWCHIYMMTTTTTNKLTVASVLPEIIEVVREADATECLTSSSEYIRECKKWHMERNM